MPDIKVRRRFYTAWQWAGTIATLALYLIVVSVNDGKYLMTALWFFPLLLVIEFGCFAARDRKYEGCDNAKT